MARFGRWDDGCIRFGQDSIGFFIVERESGTGRFMVKDGGWRKEVEEVFV